MSKQLKTYIVKATMSVELECIIEATTKEEADEMARNLDGGSFAEVENSGSWNIHAVDEEVWYDN